MRLSELAALVGGRLEGDAPPDAEITGVSSLHDALPGDVSFLANPKYAKQLASTKATAVLVREDCDLPPPEAGGALLRVESPDLAFAKAVPLFTPASTRPPSSTRPRRSGRTSPSARSASSAPAPSSATAASSRPTSSSPTRPSSARTATSTRWSPSASAAASAAALPSTTAP